MRLPRSLAFILPVFILGISGCSLSDEAEILGTEPSLAANSRGSVTIPHNYRLYPNYRAYLAAFEVERRSRIEKGPSIGGVLFDCEPMESIAVHSPNASANTSFFEEGQPLGRVYVLGRASAPQTPPYWIMSSYYDAPRRFLEAPCGGGGIGYGTQTQNHDYQADGTAIAYESTDADAPLDPPPGLTEEEYSDLNPAEKKLVWQRSLADLITMRDIRAEASSWSAQQTPIGPEDGPQDALRHAYWQCRMAQFFGSSIAKQWGDAHEKYATRPDAVRMDLYNNSVGRHAATISGSCATNVRNAFDNGWLSNTTVNAPTNPPPQTPWPPPPPADQ